MLVNSAAVLILYGAPKIFDYLYDAEEKSTLAEENVISSFLSNVGSATVRYAWITYLAVRVLQVSFSDTAWLQTICTASFSCVPLTSVTFIGMGIVFSCIASLFSSEASQSLQPEGDGAKKVESLDEASQTYTLPDIFSIQSLHLKEDIKTEVESLTKEFLKFAKEEGNKPYRGRIPNYIPMGSKKNVKIMIQVLVNNSRIFFLPLLDYIKEISKKKNDDQDPQKNGFILLWKAITPQDLHSPCPLPEQHLQCSAGCLLDHIARFMIRPLMKVEFPDTTFDLQKNALQFKKSLGYTWLIDGLTALIRKDSVNDDQDPLRSHIA